MSGQDGQASRAHDQGAPMLDSAIREETSRRYDACHRNDTFSDLVRRSSFSKEDRRLLEDWLAVTARNYGGLADRAGASERPRDKADIAGVARIWREAIQLAARCP